MALDELIHCVQRTKTRRLGDCDSFMAVQRALLDWVAERPPTGLIGDSATQTPYRRRLLNSPQDDFQIVQVYWAPGQISPIHDHQGVVGAVAALQGHSVEVKYSVTDDAGERVYLRVEEQTELCERVASPIYPDEPGQLHCMRNPSTTEPSVTVHVYLRPVLRFNQYQPQPGGWYQRVPTLLWFDAH